MQILDGNYLDELHYYFIDFHLVFSIVNLVSYLDHILRVLPRF